MIKSSEKASEKAKDKIRLAASMFHNKLSFGKYSCTRILLF